MGSTSINKEIWTSMFEAVGLDLATMHRWHAEFERRAPEAHQSFLEWLGASADEIKTIRESSRTTWVEG